MLEEKVRPYIQNIDNNVLPQPIIQAQTTADQKVFLSYSLCSSIIVYFVGLRMQLV